ncbi:copper homeostasis protein CutC [Salinicoccus sp. HZC-1]|uniref:copper homeostasis protein CutC n=1 Tax=Salinicoccus sp. HZC-1 TaxID=3385497 RepID=UPI00398B78D8
MLLEIIAANMEDVIDINRMEIDRIELCGEMDQDGLTPDRNLIRCALQESEIPVNVMIRPHDDSFTYTIDEINQMTEDIEYVKNTGANGIVIGAITKDNVVDTVALERLIESAGDLEITFHKAFDEIADQADALKTLGRYPQVRTVLTSGGPGSSADNIGQLRILVRLGNELNLTVMPGGGINLENANKVSGTAGPHAIHLGTGVRKDGTFNSRISEDKIDQLRRAIGKNES